MPAHKPIASLSLDLDNQWSYMKIHGDPGWDSFPSYLDFAVPRILSFLKARNLTITFFIVGQDAVFDRNVAAIRAIAEAGHEIGNHSFHHDPWFHTHPEEQIEAEIIRAEEAIMDVTGCKPVGFRGPGYSVSPTIIEILIRRGYRYDTSTLPTYIGPLARLYYFMTSRLNPDEKRRRNNLFGSVRDGFRPVAPYYWNAIRRTSDGREQRLIEIPVTTMPVFKIPIHVSYLVYLSRFSPALALFYFQLAIGLCRLTGMHPSLLLHPLDFLGYDDFKELSFFPGMDLPAARKLEFVSRVIQVYANHYEILPLQQFAGKIECKNERS